MLGGKTLLVRSLEKASIYSHQITVSTNKTSPLDMPNGTVRLVDETNNGGPISGLSSALTFAAMHHTAYVMIIPCDTPFCLSISFPGCALQSAKPMRPLHFVMSVSMLRVDAAYSLPGYLALGRRFLIGFAEVIGYTTAEWLEDIFTHS
jgi:molybdenum cofactor guanylyltransferase